MALCAIVSCVSRENSRVSKQKTGSSMEGIQATLQQEESLDDQQHGRVRVDTLLQSIIPQVDIERATKLKNLYSKVRKKDITVVSFLRLAKNIVGNQLLAEAVEKVQIQVSSTNTSVGAETEVELPTKRHCGEKKPKQGLTTSILPSSKRQKTSETVSDQSIEQYNDFTAVSGINLREEEEKLLSAPRKGCLVPKSSRRAVRGEEERTLILHKSPLLRKLKKITSKYGIERVSKDVEQCLSLSVEERMRGLISKLIRISKKRVDFEKSRHKTIVTLDIGHQIEAINQNVKEDLEKLHAEEVETKKRKRTVHELLQTAEVNAAARAAVGGDDLTSKWKLMAEEALKKHEKRTGAVSKAQPSEHMIQESEEKGPRDTIQRDQVQMSEKFVQCISTKDIVAVLERESQMSKSTFGYCLYERVNANPAASPSRNSPAILVSRG